MQGTMPMSGKMMMDPKDMGMGKGGKPGGLPKRRPGMGGMAQGREKKRPYGSLMK